jgi:sugar lactone lactonase YvrE
MAQKSQMERSYMVNMRWTALLALLALLLTACPSGGTGAKGQLEITVNIPAGSGISPNVLVSGPGGFSQTISQDGVRSFDSAGVGDYTITAQDVTAGGTTYSARVSVGSTPGTSSTATAAVTANTRTTVTVDYSPALSGLQVNVGNVPTNTQRVIVRARASDGTTTEDTSLSGNGSVNLNVPNGTYNVSVLAVVGTPTTIAASLSSFSASVTAPAVVEASAFTARPATGRLYLAGVGATDTPSGIAFVSEASLQSATPAVSQNRADTAIVEVNFDRSGNLFQLARGTTANAIQTLITRFSPVAASTIATTPVDFVITNGFFEFTGGCAGGTCRDRNLTAPTDMALDASGNLWLVDPTSQARIETNGGPIPATTPAGRLICYSAADLAAAAAVPGSNIGTPGIIYYGAAVAGATSLAFDRTGNLWMGAVVTAPTAARRLTRIASGSLTCPNLNPVSQTPQTPELASGERNYTVTATIGEPADIALDPSGNSLWVANRTGNNLIEVDANATTLSILRTVTVTGQPSLAPTSLAFDSRGRLWVAGGSSVFALNAISGSGAVSATVEKSFTASWPVTSLAFNLGNASTPPFLR